MFRIINFLMGLLLLVSFPVGIITGVIKAMRSFEAVDVLFYSSFAGLSFVMMVLFLKVLSNGKTT